MKAPIRKLLRDLRGPRSQAFVAKHGKLSQGMLSRLEHDPDYEATADMLLRAITGLGIPWSAFFRELERRSRKRR